LITALYDHASALAQAGDVEAARVAHEAAGRLLVAPEPANAVVDLNLRRKPWSTHPLRHHAPDAEPAL
jgi:hypothetical protein